MKRSCKILSEDDTHCNRYEIRNRITLEKSYVKGIDSG